MAPTPETLTLNSLDKTPGLDGLPSPEAFLAKLQESTQKTTDIVELKNIRAIIAKIKASSTQTHNYIAELTSTLTPEQKATAVRVDGSLAERMGVQLQGALEAGKNTAESVANKLPETPKAAKEWVDNIKASLEKGDLKKVADQAKQLSKEWAEIIEKNGEKIKQFAGSKGLEKVFLEPFQKMGFFEAIWQIMKNLGNWISNGFKFEEVIESVKDGAQGAAQKAKNVLDEKIPEAKKAPEAIASKFEQARKDFEVTLTKEWGVDFTDNGRTKRFQALWDRYVEKAKPRIKAMEGTLIDGEKGNPLYVLLGGSKDSLGFMLDLVSEDIIPSSVIKAKVADGLDAGIQFGLASAKAVATGGFDEIHMLMGEVSLAELKTKLGELSEEKRALLTKIIVQKTALPFMLMGEIGAVVMNTSILWATWNERVGINALSTAHKTAMGRFDQTASKVGELIDLLGDSAEKSNFKEAALNMRNTLVELQTKSHITHAFTTSQTAEEFTQKLAQMKSINGIDLKSIEAVQKEVKLGLPLKESAANVGKAISNRINTTFLGDTFESLKARFARAAWKGPFADPRLFANELSTKVDYTLGEFNKVVQNQGNGVLRSSMRIFHQLRAANAIHEVPGATTRGIVAVRAEDIPKFETNMKMLLANEGPDMIRSFFSHFSLAVVSTLVMTAPDGQKLQTLYHSMMGLIPFVGPMMIVGEGFSFENYKPTHPMYLATGGGLLAYDTYQLAKIWATGGDSMSKLTKTWTLFARPITMITGAGRDIVTLGRVLGKSGSVAYEAIRTGRTTEVVRLFRGVSLKTLPVAAAWVGTIAIGYHLMGNKETEPQALEAKLKSEGIIDAQGNYDPVKLKSHFASLPAKAKEQVLAMMSASSLISKETGEPLAHELRSGNSGVTVVMHDLATVTDQQNLSQAFDEMGVPLNVAYSKEGQETWMKRFKNLGYTDKESRAILWKQLGFNSNPEVKA